MSCKSASLFFSDLATGGTSNKEYRLHVIKQGSGYVVNFQYGRIGGTLQSGTMTKAGPVSFDEATKLFDRKYQEQFNQGYRPRTGEAQAAAPVAAPQAAIGQRTPYPIEALEEIEDHEADIYLHSLKYWLQKKNNGEFRQIQKLANGTYLGFNKLGNVVSDLPREIVHELDKMKAKTFFVAGELMGNRWVGENLLELDGEDYSRHSYSERFDELEGLILAKARHVTITATWKGVRDKLEGVAALKNSRAEGEVYKLISAIYQPGKSGQHKKHKYVKTLSALVTAIGHDDHNSATIGLYEGNKIIEVGHCSLNGKQEVKVGAVVEVNYLYATEGKRLVQARLPKGKRAIRTDVNPRECTTAQMIYQEGVNAA